MLNDESTLPPRIDNQLCFRILFSHCLFTKLIAYVNLCSIAKVSEMLEYCILAFICQIVLFVCTFNELFAPYLMRFETRAYQHTHTHMCIGNHSDTWTYANMNWSIWSNHESCLQLMFTEIQQKSSSRRTSRWNSFRYRLRWDAEVTPHEQRTNESLPTI